MPATKPDTVRPFSVLGGALVQSLDELVVTVRMNEAGRVSARGTVKVAPAAKVYRFKSVTRPAKPNARIRLRLRLSQPARRAVRRALRRGRKLRAALTVTSTDAAGNATFGKRSIRLRR